MKVLYIGHYRDGTGWANAAINYILALDHAGVDVVCRPVKLNNHQGYLPERILHLETKSSKGCDVVIQNVLPHLMDYDGSMYNIGLPFVESTINGTPWPVHLMSMDEVWVTNHSSMENLSKCQIQAKIIGMPINPADYTEREKIDLDLDNDFVFYTIGEMTRRKNFVAMLKAFHSEFAPSEPVKLVIKTSKHGMSSHDVGEQMKRTCQMVKEQIKMHPNLEKYKSDIIISNRLAFGQLLSLHDMCDCYVNTSFGEGCCLPAWDAMMCKNPLIVPDYLRDDFNSQSAAGFKTHKDNCSGETETFNFLFTSRDEWNAPDVLSIRDAMRRVYKNRGLYKTLAREYLMFHDYDEQCQKLRGMLDE